MRLEIVWKRDCGSVFASYPVPRETPYGPAPSMGVELPPEQYVVDGGRVYTGFEVHATMKSYQQDDGGDDDEAEEQGDEYQD